MMMAARVGVAVLASGFAVTAAVACPPLRTPAASPDVATPCPAIIRDPAAMRLTLPSPELYAWRAPLADRDSTRDVTPALLQLRWQDLQPARADLTFTDADPRASHAARQSRATAGDGRGEPQPGERDSVSANGDHPSAAALAARGQSLAYQRGRETDALADLDKAIALGANDADTFYAKGVVHLRQRDFPKALAAFEAVRTREAGERARNAASATADAAAPSNVGGLLQPAAHLTLDDQAHEPLNAFLPRDAAHDDRN